MAVAEFAFVEDSSSTSTGTQDFEKTSWGHTPNAVIQMTPYVTTSLDSAAAGAGFHIGCATGLSDRGAVAHGAKDNVASAAVFRHDETVVGLGTIRVNGAQNQDGECDFSSFAADKYVGTWDFANDIASKIGTLLIKATSVDYRTITPTTSGASISPGFDIDVAIIFSSNGTYSTSFSNHSFGFVVNGDSVQQCTQFSTADDGAANALPRMRVSDSNCGGQMTDAGALSYTVTASFPASNQMTLTSSASTGSDNFHVLCLNVGDSQAWCGIVASPTSTGSKTFSDPNFKPDLNWIVATDMEVEDSIVTSALSGPKAHCVATADDQYSISYADEYNSATMDTQSLFSTKAIEMPADDGSSNFVATLTEMGSTGATYNFTATNGTAKKWLMLSIGQEAASGGFSPFWASNATRVAGVQIA